VWVLTGKLAEIKQLKPFASREEEAFLNLGRTWKFLQGLVGICRRNFNSHRLNTTCETAGT
jgi:hypothetical protein